MQKTPGFNYKKYELPNYLEQNFNLKKIEKNIGKPFFGIDVNGCYFNTMYKLKYISPKTYGMAHKKIDEWKTGRNASVGMLAKEVVYTLYDFRDQERKVIESIKVSDKHKKAIRHHIIGNVWQTFQELFKEINSDFYMFLTDCIYVDPKHLKKVTKFFEKKGYTVKYKKFKLIKLDKTTKRVTWWDELKPNKEGGLGDIKYYNYADKLIYNKKKK